MWERNDRPDTEGGGVLVIVSVTLALFAVAIVASAKVTQVVARRLGLDLMTVLLFVGLAEWPSEARSPRGQRVPEGPARRRSPHRRPWRAGARRRAAIG